MLNEMEQKLVAALRSGKYTQTDGQLRKSDTNQYCCLGVACDISGLGQWDDKDADVFVTTEDDDRYTSEAVLPPKVLKALGWSSDSGILTVKGRDSLPPTLTELNDEYGVTFAQIADLIAAGLVETRAEYMERTRVTTIHADEPEAK